MKILLSVHRYPPHIGGSEEVTRRIAEYLALEHEVVVATSYHGDRRATSANGVTVEQFHLERPLLWPLGHDPEQGEAERYRHLFADERWDVRMIYAAQSWCLNLAWDLIGTSAAFDIFAPCGYSWLGDRRHARYFDLIADLLPRFDAVVYHSTTYQDYEFGRRSGAHNAVVIPNGVDVEEFASGGDPESTRLLTVASHVRSKGHRDLFQICERLEVPGAVVAPRPETIAKGVRGCYAECLVRSFRQPRVRLLDGTARVEVVRAFLAGGIFFLPSQVECAPLVILEAMAAGLPWVSYDVGNARELPGGIVVRDQEAATRAIAELLADPGSRRQLGGEGRDFARRNLDWDMILKRYGELCDRGSERGR